jgi:hypothetical protein
VQEFVARRLLDETSEADEIVAVLRQCCAASVHAESLDASMTVTIRR